MPGQDFDALRSEADFVADASRGPFDADLVLKELKRRFARPHAENDQDLAVLAGLADAAAHDDVRFAVAIDVADVEHAEAARR